MFVVFVFAVCGQRPSYVDPVGSRRWAENGARGVGGSDRVFWFLTRPRGTRMSVAHAGLCDMCASDTVAPVGSQSDRAIAGHIRVFPGHMAGDTHVEHVREQLTDWWDLQDLRKKYNVRSLPIRRDDEAGIMLQWRII
jgi:hypothetical protein